MSVLIFALSFFVTMAFADVSRGDPDALPSAASVYSHPWGPDNWQWGKQLFWENADPSIFAEARYYANGSLRGGVPALLSAVNWAGSNRWGDTTIDTTIAFQHNDPAWVAYTYWEYAHDSLTPINASGAYIAPLRSNTDYGWIPP